MNTQMTTLHDSLLFDVVGGGRYVSPRPKPGTLTSAKAFAVLTSKTFMQQYSKLSGASADSYESLMLFVLSITTLPKGYPAMRASF